MSKHQHYLHPEIDPSTLEQCVSLYRAWKSTSDRSFYSAMVREHPKHVISAAMSQIYQ